MYVIAVAPVESCDLCLAGLLVEVASDTEWTVRSTAATDADALTVAVEDLGLETVSNGPCLKSLLEGDEGGELLIGLHSSHDAEARGYEAESALSEYISIEIGSWCMKPTLPLHSLGLSQPTWHEDREAMADRRCIVALGALTLDFIQG